MRDSLLPKITPVFWILLILAGSGCRSVDLVGEADPTSQSRLLPRSWQGFQLYDSEGVLVYARTESAARDVATRAEQAESLLVELTAEEPTPMVYFAIDLEHPDRQQLHATAFKNAGEQWDMENRAFDFSASQGVRKESEMGARFEEAIPTILPGLLATPESRPQGIPPYCVALPTRKSQKTGIDQLFKAGIESMDLSTVQRILLTPLIAIFRGIFSEIISRVEDALIIGSHLRGRPDWDSERLQGLLEQILDLQAFMESAIPPGTIPDRTSE
jgi:hypothetical protein